MTPRIFDPLSMLRPRRKITGISAILLHFTDSGEIDWSGFAAHCIRTAEAGLTPAVNMDTGFGNLLTHEERVQVLDATRSALGGRKFTAGVFVTDSPADADAISAAKDLFLQLQLGKVDSQRLTSNARSYFTVQALEDFRATLGPLGAPTSDENTVGDLLVTTFEHGKIEYDAKTDQVEVTVNGKVVPSGL